MRLVLNIGPTISRAQLERRLGYSTDYSAHCEEVCAYRTTQPDTQERYVRVPFTDRFRQVI